MNKSIDELIGEIRGLAHNRLDRDQQERIINELRAHFDASIQARFELDPNHVGAEHEAVISFGDPVVFVDKMVAAHPPMRNSWMDRDASAALLAIMGLACSLLPLVSKLVLPISRQWQVFPWTLLLLLSCATGVSKSVSRTIFPDRLELFTSDRNLTKGASSGMREFNCRSSASDSPELLRAAGTVIKNSRRSIHFDSCRSRSNIPARINFRSLTFCISQ